MPKVGGMHNFMSMLNNRDGLEVSETFTMIYFERASLDILFVDMWVRVGKQVTEPVSGQSVENPYTCKANK